MAGAETLTEESIAKMKVADLKKALKDRGLTVTGNKETLIERLKAAIAEKVDEAKEDNSEKSKNQVSFCPCCSHLP